MTHQTSDSELHCFNWKFRYTNTMHIVSTQIFEEKKDESYCLKVHMNLCAKMIWKKKNLMTCNTATTWLAKVPKLITWLFVWTQMQSNGYSKSKKDILKTWQKAFIHFLSDFIPSKDK